MTDSIASRVRSGLTVLGVILVVHGRLQAQAVPPPGPPLPPSAVERWSDTAIGRDLRGRLAKDPTTRGARIEVAVTGGIVTLRGTAPTAAIRDQAAVLATRVPGVRQVQVELALPTPEPAPAASPAPGPAAGQPPAPRPVAATPSRPAKRPASSKKLERRVRRALRWKCWTYARDFDVRAHDRTVNIAAKVREPQARARLIRTIYALPELRGYEVRSDIRIVP